MPSKLTRTSEWKAWRNMRKRCTLSTWRDYRRYGGRGIKVCDRWQIFANFLADMGQCPSPKHSLDRIDVNGNYEPGNCRWATWTEQHRNRRNNSIVVYNGEKMPLAKAIELSGLSKNTVQNRRNRGWSDDDSLRPASKKHGADGRFITERNSRSQ